MKLLLAAIAITIVAIAMAEDSIQIPEDIVHETEPLRQLLLEDSVQDEHTALTQLQKTPAQKKEKKIKKAMKKAAKRAKKMEKKIKKARKKAAKKAKKAAKKAPKEAEQPPKKAAKTAETPKKAEKAPKKAAKMAETPHQIVVNITAARTNFLKCRPYESWEDWAWHYGNTSKDYADWLSAFYCENGINGAKCKKGSYCKEPSPYVMGSRCPRGSEMTQYGAAAGPHCSMRLGYQKVDNILRGPQCEEEKKLLGTCTKLHITATCDNQTLIAATAQC